MGEGETINETITDVYDDTIQLVEEINSRGEWRLDIRIDERGAPVACVSLSIEQFEQLADVIDRVRQAVR